MNDFIEHVVIVVALIYTSSYCVNRPLEKWKRKVSEIKQWGMNEVHEE